MPAGGDLVDVADIAAAQAASNLKPACRLLQVGAGTSLTHNANTPLLWDTEDYDYGGLHVAGTANIVLTRSGVWSFDLTVMLPARSDYITIGACIAKGGTNQAPFARWGPNATSAQRSVSTHASLLCAAGDVITGIGFHANTAAVAVTTSAGSSFSSAFEARFERDA